MFYSALHPAPKKKKKRIHGAPCIEEAWPEKSTCQLIMPSCKVIMYFSIFIISSASRTSEHFKLFFSRAKLLVACKECSRSIDCETWELCIYGWSYVTAIANEVVLNQTNKTEIKKKKPGQISICVARDESKKYFICFCLAWKRSWKKLKYASFMRRVPRVGLVCHCSLIVNALMLVSTSKHWQHRFQPALVTSSNKS